MSGEDEVGRKTPAILLLNDIMKRLTWLAVQSAQQIILDTKKLSDLIQAAVGKSDAHQQALKGTLADFRLVCRLTRAWLGGEYTDLSKRTLITLVAAIVYFLMPFDAIVDAIPVLGFMDDATVIGLALAAAKTEIGRFLEWEANAGRSRMP